MRRTLSQTAESASSPESWPRIALIGCGAIAERYYLPALARHASVLASLILVDTNRARAQKLASDFSVKHFLVDYRDVLEDVDGVIVAVPTHLHHPISMEFLSRGVHVLCEKPLAESADKAGEMVEQGQKTGAILAANYQRRLFPNLAKVNELLTNKTLGEPVFIQYSVGEKFDWPTVSGFYFRSNTSSRGVLRDRGAHVMDVICWWLGGKPKVVSSKNDSFGGSEAVAHIQFERNKCVGEVKLSWLCKLPCRFRVKCEEASIEGDVYDYQNITTNAHSGRKKRIKLKSDEKSYQDIAYKMVTNFINVVGKREKPLVSGCDVLESIKLIDECYDAAIGFDMPWYEIPEVQSGS
jgi:predicted dehydrogenase